MGIFDDRVVIVTGSGQGLGYGMARAFADEGAKLVMVEYNEATLAEKAALFREQGVEVAAVAGDVRRRATAQDAVAQALDTFGRIDVLLNNAQMLSMPVPLAEQDDEHLESIVHSGIFGTMYFMQAAYPALKERRGAIINMASGAGVVGNGGQASYAAAKEGIRGLSRVAAREWGPDGIRVNVISPAANSPSMEAWFRDRPDDRAAMIAQIPLRRFAEGYEDLGRLAVFLASPDCFLTGQTIQIDGGQIMT
jgi:NAD(P)-dependent dehydrogenase (short-subunit alcohol dehydrogenase family)